MDTKIQASDGKEHVESGKGKRSRPVTVEIVQRDKKSVLCAWVDNKLYRRAFVPASKLRGNDVDAAVLAKCLAYGLPWETLLSALPNADAIANDLRRQNIWTADDFKRDRANALAAILRASINPLVEKLVREF